VSDWMTIRVVLVGQTGDELPSPPARVLLAHADHAFSDLAEAVDTSFGRWDLTPIHQFEVEGRVLLTAGAGDGAPDAEDSDEVTIGEVGLRAGARFAYVFDLGEGWTHECTVEDVAVDPFELTGEEPELPVPVYGWGTIPDQYGRVSEDDEDEGVELTEDLEEDDPEEDADADDLEEDADDLEDWDAAESASWRVVSKALGGARPEPDHGELSAVVARLRGEGQGWERDVLWAAAGLEPEDAGDGDESLWIDLAASIVAPGGDVPLDAETAAAWATLEPADWAGAVIELVRSGPGTATTPDSVIELIARCPEVESDDLTEEDEAVILDGLGVVISLWKSLGAVDEEDALTELGQWGLPLALERAWASSTSS
jgi:hypothetical protein